MPSWGSPACHVSGLHSHQSLVFLLQEAALARVELPTTVEAAEKAIRKHKDFMMTMELHLQKTTTALKAGQSLIRQGNIYSERVKEKMEFLQAR